MAPDPEDTRRFKDVKQQLDSTAIGLPIATARPTSSEASLILIHPPGPALGLRTRIGRDPITIGRLDGCDVLDSDSLVSRTHARIESRPDGRFQITDLGSTNGTFVNHTRVTTAILEDGNNVQIGGSIYRFLTGGNIEAGYHEELHRLAVTDPLTGLPNRRALAEFLDREVERTRRYRRPLSLVMFDIDHFKEVNDRMGHVAGDATLRSLAVIVRPLVRKDEFLARYGGEEFAVALPEADAGQAVLCGERLRQAVERTPFEWEGCRFAITVSVGIGSIDGGEGVGGDGVAELIRRGDRWLYEAKHGGRNRVCHGPWTNQTIGS